ncbi:M20/M25/M40 family metallo-hydrolase [Bdellovibrio sp. SKB1291214]|uniref:M20/M25/M40 family metallo-hydrolase n=1 Tax=Bdellovibrio sp. SKB1291214 TaxID=1732569 RepID=UPI000B518203|nr:M20/M25/M40 family metallo-hydrolase [Bdellovibrio sp. SKB1291214]UYL08591.1 M20/M25/M40 family metallo-hydrolase [Bdellovibrio sp. SKB1291214]
MKIAMTALLLIASQAQAHEAALETFTTKPILADLADLKALDIPVLAKEESVGVGYAIITPEMQLKIQQRAHKVGKCGGFEDLTTEKNFQAVNFTSMLSSLAEIKAKNDLYDRAPFAAVSLEKNAQIEAAVGEVKEQNLREWVTWLSSYPTRYNRGSNPNLHVDAMKVRLQTLLASSNIPYEISLIDHSSTPQKSVRVRLTGSTRPNEVVVLGGHLDSINQGWGGGQQAPGADDNASGSANLLETLRIVSQKGQPQRSVEFFWYAGEESGLLGSAEIAKAYKNEKRDVVAVLQLDMTSYPGAGEFVIGNMTDFTSKWLHDYLRAVNETYLHARIVDDQCGYGCSDHASWFRQGYPTLMPFEATMRADNPLIHTAKDMINDKTNFAHSAMYSKLAVVFAMDLANSTARQPY